MTSLKPLMERNFLEYASYVVVDRAIPEIRDGCKPVQRRILHTLFTMDDGKFMKVANVIGECMKLHPHGDASIGDALVVLANKGYSAGNDTLGYFIERQGNFGNIFTGHGAAAARYIECRLTPLAKETLFNPALTTFTPSYDGRKEEPLSLPAKIPAILLLGTEGIAVGMATTILSHNFGELLMAQIKILKGERFKLYPDFATGGLMDVTDYADGNGSVKIRARIDSLDDKSVVVRDIPFGTTVESLINSIESAVEKGKVKISEISDRTGEQVEIVLKLARGTHADEVIPQLYAYTDCEVKLTSNIVVIRERKPAELTVTEILTACTDALVKQIHAELEHELAGLIDKRHYLTLEQIFIENRVYKRIETATSEAGVDQAVRSGMAPFSAQFVRELVDSDVERLLELRIKRISQYDIDKNRKDIDDIIRSITAVRNKLKDLTGTTIAWIEYLHGKYAKLFPRRTKVKAMEEIDKKSLATANIKLVYDASTGFFGSSVRSGDRELKVTEYDRIIAIMDDGRYRIMAPPEKTVLEGKLLYLDVFDPEGGLSFTMVYRDKDKEPWAKKTTIASFIKDKEYELIKDSDGKILYFTTATPGMVNVQFIPQKGQRVTDIDVNLATIEPCGPATRGTKIADKPTQRVVRKT